MSNQYKSLILLSLVAALASCSANPSRFQDKPDGVDGPTTTNPDLPDTVEPLKIRDGEPEVKVLAQNGNVKSFQVGEVLLIHKATNANSIVSANLYIAGGVRNLKETTQGAERLALSTAVNGGTETTPRDAFNAKLDSTGSSIFAFADRDYSGYGLKTLTDNFDQTWTLFEQAIVEPAMPSEEIETLRTKQLAEIASMTESPDGQTNFAASQAMFDGHPYKLLQIGTEANVKSFSRNQLIAYQRSHLVPSRMVMVVVGNVPSGDIVNRLKKTIARIDNTQPALEALPAFSSVAGSKFIDRKMSTNYVIGLFDAPAPGHPDYAATLVATEYLSGKLFEEVRTKRNLTYAVQSRMRSFSTNYGYLYVTATQPEKTMQVIFDQVAELKILEVPKAELDQTINVFITNYYMGLETNADQASYLARWQLMTGDWQNAERLLAQMQAVTPADVQRVSQTYLKNYRFAVVGDSGSLNPAWFKGDQ